MSAFICQSCGAPMEATLGMKVLTCRYCGAVQAVAMPEEERDDELTKHYQAGLDVLKKKQWKKAREMADRLTVMAQGNVLPCFLHMMCEYKVDREEKLAKLPYDLADSPYYRMIMEDGSDEMKAKVEGYRKACFPAYCDRVINTSLDRKEMENAAKILEEFPDIPHRDEFLKACREKLAVFDRVMDDLEYIQDRIEEIPKECHREGRKAKLQDKLVEMADHVRGKFKGCGFVPLIVHLPDCNSLFGGFGGASYYVEAGALGQELVMSSEVQLVMMLVDKNLTKLVVSDYGEHRYSEKAEPEHRKEIAVKFADSKLAVLHINVNAFRYGLDVDFL